MRLKRVSRKMYRRMDGKKCMAITMFFRDGSVKTLDATLKDVRGLAGWLTACADDLESRDISTLSDDDSKEEYRIIRRPTILYKPLTI